MGLEPNQWRCNIDHTDDACSDQVCALAVRRSNAPTAFTGYSFHVVEAAIVFANEILVCFLFPIHIGVHRIYHLFTTVIHNGENVPM